jgi:hypothetical protein
MNPFSNPSYLLPPLIALFGIICLLVLIWQKGRWSKSSVLFSGMLLCFGLWSLFTFFMRSSPNPDHALPWEKALIVSGGIAFALYYHFTLTYTNVRIKKWVLPAVYLVIAMLAALIINTDLAIKGMSLESYGYTPITGPILYLAYIPAPLLILGGIYNLLKKYHLSASLEERNHLLYLAAAAFFPLIGVALDAFTDLPPAAIWGNLAFCILCSIAILKYHLLDIY